MRIVNIFYLEHPCMTLSTYFPLIKGKSLINGMTKENCITRQWYLCRFYEQKHMLLGNHLWQESTKSLDAQT